MQPFDYQKSVQALNFFATKAGGQINKMKALKLIWLSDRLHLRTYCRPILNDKYVAMKLGPVASTTRDLLEVNLSLGTEKIEYRNHFIESVGRYFIRSTNSIDMDVFSETDIESMETIFAQFGKLGSFHLSTISHDYPEWKKFEPHIKNRDSASFPMDYDDFFLNAEGEDEEESVFSIDEESLALAREIFFSNKEIISLL